MPLDKNRVGESRRQKETGYGVRNGGGAGAGYSGTHGSSAHHCSQGSLPSHRSAGPCGCTVQSCT